jgi:hypothetical protein
VCPSKVRFLFGKDALGDGVGDVAAKKESEEIVCDCDCFIRDGNFRHPDFPKEARKATADPPMLEAVTEGERDLAGGVFVRRVAELCLPVEVVDSQTTPMPEYAAHFREGLFGIGNMHEHALCADGVKRMVGEAEGLCVPDLKGNRETTVGGATDRFRD